MLLYVYVGLSMWFVQNSYLWAVALQLCKKNPTTHPTPTESYKAEEKWPTSRSFAQATYLTLHIIA